MRELIIILAFCGVILICIFWISVRKRIWELLLFGTRIWIVRVFNAVALLYLRTRLMVLAICCVMLKFSSLSCKLRVFSTLNWLGNLRLIIVLLVIRLSFSWLIWILLSLAEVFASLIRILFCVSVYIWLLTFLSGVINNVFLRKFLVFFMEEIIISMVCFWRLNGGSDVVIIIVATFFSCILVFVGTVIFSCESMLLSVCVVNGVWVVWLSVLFSFIIRL